MYFVKSDQRRYTCPPGNATIFEGELVIFELYTIQLRMTSIIVKCAIYMTNKGLMKIIIVLRANVKDKI